MGRLIDADALGNRLYHEVFEKDSEDQRWDRGGEQMNNGCDYCSTDADGWVKPIEKNGHAYIYRGMFGRWELNIRLKGDRRACDINYCPMCGRRLIG